MTCWCTTHMPMTRWCTTHVPYLVDRYHMYHAHTHVTWPIHTQHIWHDSLIHNTCDMTRWWTTHVPWLVHIVTSCYMHICFLMQGNWGAAKDHLNKAIETATDSVDLLLKRAEYFFSSPRPFSPFLSSTVVSLPLNPWTSQTNRVYVYLCVYVEGGGGLLISFSSPFFHPRPYFPFFQSHFCVPASHSTNLWN